MWISSVILSGLSRGVCARETESKDLSWNAGGDAAYIEERSFDV
jgi:hypothetical protein